MSDNTQELREAVKDGLANHTGEFANPWIFKGHYSHELLADILNDIMASERLFKNLEALINQQIKSVLDEALANSVFKHKHEAEEHVVDYENGYNDGVEAAEDVIREIRSRYDHAIK